MCTITSMSLIQRQPGDVDLACLLHLLEIIFSCKLSKLFEQLKLKLRMVVPEHPKVQFMQKIVHLKRKHQHSQVSKIPK